MQDSSGPGDGSWGKGTSAAGDDRGRLRPGPGQDPALVAAHQRVRLQRAMTELVYEVGYRNVTLAKLLPRAAVSKPTYYRLFAGKEECFSAAHTQVVEEVIRCTGEATAGAHTRPELVERGFEIFCEALAARPDAAHLALIEPRAVGEDARRRMLDHEAEFATMLRSRFSELADPVVLPAALAFGIILGAECAGRRRLDEGEPRMFREDAVSLTGWATAVSDVEAFRRFLRSDLAGTAARPVPPGKPPLVPGDDERTMLINAVLRLGAERGYAGLDVARILTVTGLRRSTFDAHFDSLDSCFAAAWEASFVAVLSQAGSAYRGGASGPLGVARAISAVTAYLAGNPYLTRFLFVDVFLPGREVIDRGAGLLPSFARLLRAHLPGKMAPGDEAGEAAVGAVWNLMQREVEHGKLRSLPRLAPALTWLVLAPSWQRTQGAG